VAEVEERFADVKSTRMRYLIGGDGPPLVLVHGLSGAASNWFELAALLTSRYRLLIPELPGHGGSSPLPAAPNLDVYADRVFAVASREGMLPAPMVGHSMGGVVALRLAVRRPHAVSALVLASSAGIASGTRWAEFWINVFGIARPGRLAARWTRTVARSNTLRRIVFTRWETADPLVLSNAAVEGFLTALGRHTDVLSAGRALVVDDPRTDLARVTCPALVIWGARDHQVPVDNAFEYARRLSARLRVVAHTGHLVVAENAPACADAIAEFLSALRE
jgi:pimeloyl-ACP methyl ester carboxylesterase